MSAQQSHHEAQPTNGLAIGALVLGITGILTFPIGSAVAIALGHIACSQIRRTGEPGEGMAIAGLVLGYITIAGYLLLMLLLLGVVVIAIAIEPTSSLSAVP